ncbi:MAG: SPASM domain-containing protein, partial [Clostridiales bacterium]|nr:SPASM domain-containing protein [Clostridiales bacterium]
TASILNNGDIFACVDIERKSELIQGNIRTDCFSDVWKNQFSSFRQRRDKKSSICADCLDANFCRGDSAHTWDFDNNAPRYCLKNL